MKVLLKNKTNLCVSNFLQVFPRRHTQRTPRPGVGTQDTQDSASPTRQVLLYVYLIPSTVCTLWNCEHIKFVPHFLDESHSSSPSSPPWSTTPRDKTRRRVIHNTYRFTHLPKCITRRYRKKGSIFIIILLPRTTGGLFSSPIVVSP